MEKIHILFQYKPELEVNGIYNLPVGYKIEKFTPSIIDVLKNKASITEYLWRIITVNNYVLYCVRNENSDTIHKSARIGKCYKFSFLKKNEYEIGPCYTSEQWRGKGIYPFVLKQIISDTPKANFYMFIDEKNISSIRGVEKVGFTRIGQIKRGSNGIWKRI